MEPTKEDGVMNSKRHYAAKAQDVGVDREPSVVDSILHSIVDVTDSVQSSLNRLEHGLSPIRTQASPADRPDNSTSSNVVGGRPVSDSASPLAQRLSSEKAQLVSILNQVNLIIDSLEI